MWLTRRALALALRRGIFSDFSVLWAANPEKLEARASGDVDR
jgi:hypothetical protein